jgi:hypothetical protein
MNKYLFILAFLAIATCGVFAEVTGSEDQDAEKPNALSCSLGVSAGDILDEAGAIVKVGAAVDNIFGSGLSLGVDTMDFTLYPEMTSKMEVYLERSTPLGASPFDVGYGAHYSMDDLSDAQTAALWALGSLEYSPNDIKAAQLELDAFCLDEGTWAFSLAAIVGGGWEFAFNPSDKLSCWVDFNFNLHPNPSFGDIEGSLTYEHAFGDRFSLALEIAPTLIAEDNFEFSCEPTLTASMKL